MKANFRQTMAWVHTWGGLVCGWLLCAIFLTGTLSVFRDPITRWMAARPVAGSMASTDEAASALAHAIDHLQHHARQARFWRIHSPEHPGDALLLVWRTEGRNGVQQQAALDPGTGAALPQPWGRQTEGGRHFMLFHYMLHGGTTGFWVVGAVAMFARAALVSGVIVHRRILADFFTFRPGKGQRSWLDAHNVTGMLTLPFLFMIVYTGVAYFYTSYMPWPLQAVYGSERADASYQKELVKTATVPPRARSGNAAMLADVPALVSQARRMSGAEARLVMIDNPGDAQATIRVFGKHRGEQDTGGDRGTLLDPPSLITFDGVSGTLLNARVSRPGDAPSGDEAPRLVRALHAVTFGGWGMKWLYFVSGLLGTAMIATGTTLFMVKRRRSSEAEFGLATPGFYRFVEAMNVASMAGVCLASIGYLYANRLIPADMAGRDLMEIRAFLLMLGASLIHARWQPPRKAWVQQFALAGLSCVALPLLNLATTGEQIGSYAARGDWQSFGVECTAIVFGAGLLLLARRLHLGWDDRR